MEETLGQILECYQRLINCETPEAHTEAAQQQTQLALRGAGKVKKNKAGSWTSWLQPRLKGPVCNFFYIFFLKSDFLESLADSTFHIQSIIRRASLSKPTRRKSLTASCIFSYCVNESRLKVKKKLSCTVSIYIINVFLGSILDFYQKRKKKSKTKANF